MTPEIEPVLEREAPVSGRKSRLLGSRLFRDTSWTLVLKIPATGLAFLLSVVLARALGADGYGIYAYALAVTTLLSIPTQVGLPVLVVRETAHAQALDRPALVKGVWTWAGRVTGVLSLVLVSGALLLLIFTTGGGFSDQAWTMVWALLLVPLASLGNLRGAALRGLRRILAGQLPEFVLRPTFQLVLTAGFLVLAGTGLKPQQAMALYVVAAALSFGVGAWLLWRYTPVAVRQATKRFETRAWLASAWPLALIAGIAAINRQTDVLVLGLFETPDQVGIYKVASQAAFLAGFGLQAVNLVIAPRIARLDTLGDTNRLQRIATGGSRLALTITAGVTVVIAFLGEQVIELSYGSEFTSAYLPLVIMLGGQLVNAAAGSAGQLLIMTGHERDSARSVAASAAFHVGISFLLIPKWGIVGAAVATASSLIVLNLWLVWAVRRRLGIRSTVFGVRPKEFE